MYVCRLRKGLVERTRRSILFSSNYMYYLLHVIMIYIVNLYIYIYTYIYIYNNNNVNYYKYYYVVCPHGFIERTRRPTLARHLSI